jgi:hypothetical protein
MSLYCQVWYNCVLYGLRGDLQRKDDITLSILSKSRGEDSGEGVLVAWLLGGFEVFKESAEWFLDYRCYGGGLEVPNGTLYMK